MYGDYMTNTTSNVPATSGPAHLIAIGFTEP